MRGCVAGEQRQHNQRRVPETTPPCGEERQPQTGVLSRHPWVGSLIVTCALLRGNEGRKAQARRVLDWLPQTSWAAQYLQEVVESTRNWPVSPSELSHLSSILPQAASGALARSERTTLHLFLHAFSCCCCLRPAAEVGERKGELEASTGLFSS